MESFRNLAVGRLTARNLGRVNYRSVLRFLGLTSLAKLIAEIVWYCLHATII